MQKIFTSPNPAEVGLLASLLEAEGIACFVKNKHLSLAAGSIPFTECWPEIWVSEGDLEDANVLIAQWQNAARTDDESAAD